VIVKGRQSRRDLVFQSHWVGLEDMKAFLTSEADRTLSEVPRDTPFDVKHCGGNGIF